MLYAVDVAQHGDRELTHSIRCDLWQLDPEVGRRLQRRRCGDGFVADCSWLPAKLFHCRELSGGELEVRSQYRVTGCLTPDHALPGAAQRDKRWRSVASRCRPDGEVGGVVDHGDDLTQPALELSPGLSGTPVEVEVVDVGHMRPSHHPRQRQ